MYKNLSRRQFIQSAALLAAGGALAACAPTPTTPDQPDVADVGDAPAVVAPRDRTLIKYWVFWGQLAACEAAWRATDEWKAMEEDNNWEIEFRTGAGGDAGRTAVAAGTPPDVGNLGPQYDFALGGRLIDLTDLVAASPVINQDMYFEPNWKGCFWEGHMFRVPAHEGFVRRTLYYNARMVEEAGLDPTNPPETWEELFEWHKDLTKFDAAGNIIHFGLDPFDAEGGTGPGGDGWGIMDVWDITDFFDETAGTFNINQPAFVEALDSFCEFTRYVGPDNLQAVRSVEGQGTWGGAFNAEVQAMIIEGYWHAGETYHEAPEVAHYNTAAWVPVPSFRRGDKIQCYSGHGSSLFVDGDHALEAWPILEWLQSDANNQIIFETIGWLPAIREFVENIDHGMFPGLTFVVESAEKATHRYGEVQIPIRSFMSQKFVEYRERVFRNEMTAQQAADEFQRDVEREWDESGWAERWGER